MREIELPEVVEEALQRGASLAVSISGGKDSQALLAALVEARAQRRWPGPFFAIHAHLGRMEWPQTLEHCQRLCDGYGVELVVVSRPQGDLLAEMQQRMETLRGQGKPHWPSSAARYCTADNKRGPIDKVLRQSAPHWPSATNRYCTSHQKANQIDKRLRAASLVISAEGIRADESYARAKRSVVAIRRQITAKALRELEPGEALRQQQEGQRLALTWNPLLTWTVRDVWEACGTSAAELAERRVLWRVGWEEEALNDWPAHPAYVMGNERLSCALCVLASRSDLENGARHNRELWQALVAMEEESGFTFRQDLALADLEP